MATSDILSSLNKTGSGINLSELATSLVDAATAASRKSAEDQISRSEVAISALGTLRAQLAGLAGSVQALAAQDVLSVTSGSSAIRTTVTDRNAVATTSATVEVLQLAAPQVLEFGGFTSRTQALPAGRLTLETGAWYTPDGGIETFAQKPGAAAVTIEIAAGTTVEQLAQQLSKVPGVSAALVDKGDGTFSLGVLSASGAGNALRITATGAGLEQFDTTATNASVQAQAARNAVLTVNGLMIQRESNVIEDALAGLSMTVTATTGAVTLSAGRNEATALGNLQALVGQLNAAREMLSSMTQRSGADTTAGALPGDTALRQIALDLDALLRTPIPGYGAKAPSAADFGIRSQQDGTLYVDKAVFAKAFAADPAKFDALFADRLQAEGIEIGGTVPPTFLPGSHSFRRDPATGEATLDGRRLAGLDLGDGRYTYTALTGPAAGLILTVPADMTSANIEQGTSLVTRLTALVDRTLASDGTLGAATDRYSALSSGATAEIDRVESRASSLKELYMQRFAAMEAAVTKFNSTSTYIDSLVKQWNADD